MNILITGGAGFIGSQLGYYLSTKGHRIVLLDNMSYGKEENLLVNGKTFGTFIKADIRDKNLVEIMKKHAINIVYHFAGIAPLPDCQLDPGEAISVNVSGTANVLEAARQTGVKRVIFSSTSATYENNSKFPCKEYDPVSPDLIYAMSKQQAEILCRGFVRNYGLPIIILRFFNVYGPNQDFMRKAPPLIGYVIKQLVNDEPCLLHSDGKQSRDYVYSSDLVRLCEIVLKKGISGEIYNVASGKTISVQEIYDILANILGSKRKPIYKPSKHLWIKYPQLFAGTYPLSEKRLAKEVDKFAQGSTTKTKKELGWTSNTTVKDGLKEIVDYVRRHSHEQSKS